MRRLVVSEFVTLDGVMEAPETWSLPYWSDEVRAFKRAELEAADSLLLGRRTYDTFAAAWPGRTDDDGFAARMNALPKAVVTGASPSFAWSGAKALGGPLADAVSGLKFQDGGDILVAGSRTLVAGLLAHGLVDDLQLLVYPLMRGAGSRLFPDGAEHKLRLVSCREFPHGVVGLRYGRPDAS